jgi:hypothetical protein
MTTTSSSRTLELAWRPEPADYAEAFRAHDRATGAQARLAALFVLALLVVGAGLAMRSTAVLAVACAGLISCPLVVLVVQPLRVRSMWRRNPALHADVRATVDPAQGITIASHTTGLFPWSSVGRVLETGRVFVVQLTGYRAQNFVLLAKRGVLAGDVEDVRRLLAAGAG